jgi:hypothetical protein
MNAHDPWKAANHGAAAHRGRSASGPDGGHAHLVACQTAFAAARLYR